MPVLEVVVIAAVLYAAALAGVLAVCRAARSDDDQPLVTLGDELRRLEDSLGLRAAARPVESPLRVQRGPGTTKAR